MNLPTIATLGGHSALEICLGAKKYDFKTLVIVQKGRDKTYNKHFKNIVDVCITVDSFSELTEKKVVRELIDNNCIFIPHRYCQVYCDLKSIEKNFPVPVFGNKFLLKYEERSGDFNQYHLLQKTKLEYPKQFSKASDIDRLVIVKVKEALRGYERAFFFARSFDEFKKQADKLIMSGKIKRDDLGAAVIEEYIIGTQINFNFFYSVISGRLELLGTDTRRQTNIDGLVRLPAWQQNELIGFVIPSYIETGHVAVTVKESLLGTAFDMAEKLVSELKKSVPPGIIGPFALQCAIIPGPPKERIVVYDLSLRIPGSPGTAFTPYSQYHFGRAVSFGERLAMEIKDAVSSGDLKEVTT